MYLKYMRSSSIFMTVFALFLALSLLITPYGVAHAATSKWVQNPHIEARLITGKTDKAALEVSLEEGWHTYWYAPGDAGLPPRFEWGGSDNVSALDVFYPPPAIFDESGFTTYGYKGRFLLPLIIKRENTEKAATVDLEAHFMICKDICIPQAIEISHIFPNRNVVIVPAQDKDAIAEAHDSIAKKSHPALKLENVVIGEDSLVMAVNAQKGIETVTPIITYYETNAETAYSQALTKPHTLLPNEKDPRAGMLIVPKPDEVENLNFHMSGKTVRVMLKDENGVAIEQVIAFPARPFE